MAQKNVREIIAEIRKGNIAPVYILMGEEAYFIDLIVENLEAFAVDEADKDFNYNVYYGSDADIDTVVAAAQQFPVMAPRKRRPSGMPSPHLRDSRHTWGILTRPRYLP
jgi:DNA polymerase-3 subunit delta